MGYNTLRCCPVGGVALGCLLFRVQLRLQNDYYSASAPNSEAVVALMK